MKRLLSFVLFLLIFIFSYTTIFAHSGRTDGNGGHYDDDGDYHYHHGFPAHDHPGGKCPYEDDEPYYKANGNSNGSTTSSSDSSWNIIEIIFFSVIGGIIALPFLWLIFDTIKEKISSLFHKNVSTDTVKEKDVNVTEKEDGTAKSEIDMKNYTYTTKTSYTPKHSVSPSDYDELARLRARVAKLLEENQHLKNELYAVEKELENERFQRVSKQETKEKPEYLKLSNESAYREALESSRKDKADPNKIVIKKIAAKMYSGYSGKTYNVSLDSCTCEDFKFRKKPCKHMIAFAIEINALK